LRPPLGHFAIPTGSGVVWDQLEKAGVPGVKGVWSFVYGSSSGYFTIVSIEQQYPGHAKQAGLVACGCRAGAYGGRIVVVVDDDVDITNPQEVIWVLATRCNVSRGVDIIKDLWTSASDPTFSPSRRAERFFISDRIIMDACRPFSWKDNFPRVNAFERGYKREVAKRWGV